METRSKTKANLAATEAGRAQREGHEHSPRGARPGSAATTDGSASALPDSPSTQTVDTNLRGGARPGPALDHPSARASSHYEGKAKTPPKGVFSVHSKQTCSEHTHSSRSSVTVRAQKLALQASAIRRQVDREREQAEREREREHKQAEREREREHEQAEREREREHEQAEREREREHEQAEREREAEQAELQAKLAALEASLDKSAKSRSSSFSSRIADKRTATWVSEQNANMAAVSHTNVPGEAPTVTLSNPQGRYSQPAAPTNTVSFGMPDVNRATRSKPTHTALTNQHDTVVEQRLLSERPASDPIKELTHAINALSNRPKKPELVPFSGEIGQWMAFKSSYERTKSKFSPSENLDRLNHAIRGPAYQSIASLLWTSSNTDDVVRALEQTYARPELLVARAVAELRNSPKLSSPEDLNGLANKLRNFVTTLKLLKQNEYLSSPELFQSVMTKLSEHTRARFTDFASVCIPEEQTITKLELLSRFLLAEADKQLKYNFVTGGTVKAPTTTPMHPSKYNLRKETVHATTSNDKTPERCTYCKQGPHSIKTCKKFLALIIDDRWRWVRETKLCYRCLKSNPHTWNNCRAKRCGIDGCSRRHNALLHGNATANLNTSAVTSGQCNNTEASPASTTDLDHSSDTDNETEPAVEITNTSDFLINATGSLPSASRPRGLLKVVPIVLEGPNGEFETTALLDEGSTATLVDAEVAARIGMKPTGQERLRIEGVSGMTKEVEVSYVDFYIRGRNRSDRYLVKHARAIKPLALRTQNPDLINFTDYGHLSDLSNELSYSDTPPTVLIGAPDWHLSLSREVRCGKRNEPVASRTLLGWVLHGALSVSSKPLEFVNHVSDDLDALIKTQYEIDALGITKNAPQPNDDDKRAVDIIESSAHQLDNGHFEVGLPWKKDLPKIIPDSYPQALSRFKALERQMSKDPAFAAAFQRFIDDVISKGYAEECDPKTYHQRLPQNVSHINADGSIRWYLPIFGVLHPQKKKLRAVHDAAAATKSVCLNSLLLQGPDLLSPLLNILFRFREGAIALNGDIKEMFPQVKITPRDRDAQRFLWRNKDGDLKEYRMASMIFGAVSSPFVALYIKNKNAKMLQADYPAACKAIIEDHYMDDYLGSHSSVSDAAQLAADVVTVHKACGFEMRAWTSNHPDALSLVPKELRSEASSDVYLPPSSEVGVLGVKWNPLQDSLGFRTVPQIPTGTLTKRSLLSNVMQVYDPLGLIMPVVIWGRILIQRLWRAGVSWDAPLPEACVSECEDWFRQLQVAAAIKIPRWYMNRSDVTDVQLHVIADGGEQAYACVAYWRFSHSDDSVSTALIGSKARVSPLKPVSIPRLELQASVIASRFAQTILQAHRLKPSETIFWTDSTTVLKWIRSDARAYKPFVAHRLGEILETTNPSSWRWIPTSRNVADDATKPKKINLTSSHRWFTGPQFLSESPCTWPTECTADVEEITPDPELKSDLVVLLLNTPLASTVPEPTRFSSWLCLLRATARVLQGARLFRLKLSRPIALNSKLFIDSATSPYQLHAADIVEAEKMVTQRAQTDSFPDELTALRCSKPVPKSSRIVKLAPILDQDGLLRLDTRIRSAPEVNENVKSPIILDGRHHAVRLLILHEHIKAAHHFNELVLNELRQRFWILRARDSIRGVAHACLICRRWKGQPVQPQAGNLPLERLDHHKRPFTHVGLDYFGPVMVTIYRRKEKRYVALYTCLVTRALHLEIVTSLSSDAAIMSLRRFIARRGSPTTIISDNGTNFVGASNELRCLHDDCVKEYATNHKIDWRFIPPASPFMGGAWERLVRTVKTALKSCLANQPAKEDVLATLLLEAEAIVNSRPLTYVSSSPDSPEAITPFHFILGTSSVVPWTSSLTDADLLRRCDWRRTLRLADQFWARWLREYLPTLRPRGPTTDNALNLGEGDVVLIADANLPRGLWPLGRIEKVYLGPDGAVRVVDVRTRSGVLRRPARKLILMEAAPQPVTTGC